MFKFLRSQAKYFYWFITITFLLGFVVLAQGRGCESDQSRVNSGIIGSVNGTQITGQDYENFRRNIVAQMRQGAQGRELNANQYASAREMAWDYLVRDILVQQAIDEYDIKVTDEEVLDVFRNNPPPELLQGFVDENGQIDLNRYFAELSNPDNDWTWAENYVRQQLPRQKLEALVAQDAFVSDDEVRAEYVRQTGRAVAEYVGVLYADLETPEPADDEIQAWYDSHADDYQSPAKADCQVVRFEKAASDADYDEVLAFMNQEIRPRIVSGELTFEQAAMEYGEDSSAELGGDLGTFDRNRMVDEFTEAAFSLPVGELSEPVRTKFGWHLIEVLEQDIDEETNEVFQVHARHILLNVTPSADTLEMIRAAAEDFRSRVDGGSFASTAEAEAHDLIDPQPFIEGRDIPGIPFSLAGSQWAFQAKAGEISPVFENDSHAYVLMAEQRVPAGTRPLDEVRGQVRLAVQKEHNRTAARALLGPAVGEIQMGASMEEAAGGGTLVYAVTDTFGVNDNIRDVGYGTDFNRLAIEGEVGTLIPEVETLRGLYALTPLWINEFDSVDFVNRKDGIRAALLNQKRGEIVEQWFTDRENAADIVDHRHLLMQGS